MFELTEKDAVIAVDVQRDFCPGGALAVAEGDAVVPILNRWIQTAEREGVLVVVSRDWHPPDHISFETRNGPWPVHCVQHSEGARLHPDLHLADNVLLVSKGRNPDSDQYSVFDRTGVAERLKRFGIERLWIGGLAMDVCVKATVIDACKAGFETHLLREATRAVNQQPGDDERALREMKEAGAILEEGAHA